MRILSVYLLHNALLCKSWKDIIIQQKHHLMNLIQKICCRVESLCAIALCAGAFVSCAEHDLNINGGTSGENDYNELFAHAFIKEFGVFKGKPWSAAVNGAIRVRTAQPTAINVFADVEGERYIFASLGSVNGLQPIVVTIPVDVKELIVTADGEEYKVKLGETLDLTKNVSRYHITPEFVTDIPALNGFEIVRMPEAYREIGIDGTRLRDVWLRYGQGKECFNIFDADHNFTNGENNSIFNSAHFYGSQSDDLSDFTVYPLYWRENRYGESDYLLGIYYYHKSIGDNNVTKEIRMIDLDDFDLKGAISFKKTGSGEFVISQEGEAYDARNLGENDEFHSKGYHLKMKNIMPDGENILASVGFYIKSGLKPGSTPEKGRNYTHITFQNAMFNGIEWGDDNYWDTTLANITKSYSGAATSTSTVVDKNNKPERVDGLSADLGETGTNDILYYTIGFTSQPDGPASPTPDYSDVVIAWTHKSGGQARELVGKGETYGAFPWYLASEDLGSMDDWDFNDIVVTIYDLTTDLTRPYVPERGRYPVPTIMGRRITVVPRAAGSTMPIYLIYEGEVSEDATDDTLLSAINAKFTKGSYVVGAEIHEWLGEPDYTQMLNTGINEGYDGCGVSFCIPVDDFSLSQPNFTDFPQTIGYANQALRNFWVLVDKEDAMRAELSNPLFDRTPIEPEYNKNFTKVTRNISRTKDVLRPFSGRLGQGAYKVDPPSEDSGTAPQMLMCHCTWRWPLERVNIGDAYTSFRDWVVGKRTTWHANPAAGEDLNAYYPDMVHPYVATSWMQ